ncbi:MAG: FHA domain-containing protein [Gemmatimonadetes bacterium]|nr:FHA domain-containing protein [Gemmatimonadota bacterium]
MPYIQFNDQQLALGPTDLAIGTHDGAALRLPGDDPAARALVRIGADGTGIIAKGAPDAVVLVNGVHVGVEPSPLLHGDKVEIGGHALRYADDQKGGSTQFVSAAEIAQHLQGKAGAPKKPTSASGGRLVSLVDGREYAVGAGVTFGREAGNDIVVASTEVSRKHASIAPNADGYELHDLSTNGVFVNGSRVEGAQVLGRGDVIKVGPEEFRFYADAAKPAAAPAPVVAASAPPPEPVPEAPAPAAASAPADVPLELDMIELEDAMAAATAPSTPEPAPAPVAAAPPAPAAPAAPAVPAAPAAPAAPVAPVAAAPPAPKGAPAVPPLATLEVINEGPMKGTKWEIHSPLTNVGRGPHNDIVIAEESLSGSHAKILKRDGAWWVVDQGSTNGTYVGGRRVQGEQQLTGAPDLRFGSIKVIFRPAAEGSAADGTGTRAIAAVHVDAARKVAAKPRAAAPAAPEGAKVPAEKKKGCAAMIAFLLTMAAAGVTGIVFLFTTRG